MTEETKKWYASKTLWVNVAAVLGVIFTDVSSLIGTTGTITALGVMNIILRAVTNSGIEL